LYITYKLINITKSTIHINERNTNNEMYQGKNTQTSKHSQYTCIVAVFRKWYL